jgi:hypothetical protein
MGLETLEAVLGYIYRDLGSIQRVAEMAGLNVSRIALEHTTPVTAWHNVLIEAELQGRANDLRTLTLSEFPKHVSLAAAWAAHDQDTAGTGVSPRPSKRRNPPAMSETDTMRIDQLQREIGALQAQQSAMRVQIDMGVEQNKTIIAQQQALTLALAALQKRLLNLFLLLVAVVVIGVMVAAHLWGGSNAVSGRGVDGVAGGLAVVGGVVWAVFQRDALGAGAGGAAAADRQDN